MSPICLLSNQLHKKQDGLQYLSPYAKTSIIWEKETMKMKKGGGELYLSEL